MRRGNKHVWYTWTTGHGHSGQEETMSEAYDMLDRHLSYSLDDAIIEMSPDGTTRYYYETETDQEEDTDGAYAAQITMGVSVDA